MADGLSGILGGVGGAVGGAVQANAAKQIAKDQQRALEAAAAKLEQDYQDALGSAGNAFGRVPQAALFDPINLSRSQLDSVRGNQSALSAIDQLTSGANDATLRGDLSRIQQLVPGYQATSQNLGRAASALSAGMLPFEDVQDIVSDRSSSSGALNVPGGSSPATLRDLGMSRIGAINQGNSLFQSMIAGANAGVSPVSDQMRTGSFFTSPQQQGNLDLQQAQLIQNSDQNANDLAASPDPGSAGRLQLRLTGANNAASTRAQIAGLDSPIIPNYASYFGQIGSGLGDLFFGKKN